MSKFVSDRQKKILELLDTSGVRLHGLLARLMLSEELGQVLDAMGQLNDLAREVLVMHYIEQESYEQIAQQLGKKSQHIRSVSAKAMARLRKLMQAEKTCPSGKE